MGSRGSDCCVLWKWQIFIKMRAAFLAASSLELWRKERARKAALILMKNSHFDRTLRYNFLICVRLIWEKQFWMEFMFAFLHLELTKPWLNKFCGSFIWWLLHMAMETAALFLALKYCNAWSKCLTVGLPHDLVAHFCSCSNSNTYFKRLIKVELMRSW